MTANPPKKALGWPACQRRHEFWCPVQRQPAAQVNAGGQTETCKQPGFKRPRAQKGIERGTHGVCVPEAAAVGWNRPFAFPGGRKLAKKSTSAVISSGLICLP